MLNSNIYILPDEGAFEMFTNMALHEFNLKFCHLIK